MVLSIVAVACLGALAMAGEVLVWVTGSLKTLRWLLLVFGISILVFTPGTPVWEGDMIPFSPSWNGIELAVLSSSRMVLMFVVSLVLVRTTPPERWAGGLGLLRSRFGTGGILGRGLQVGMYSFQMLPALWAEMERWAVRPGDSNTGGERFGWSLESARERVGFVLDRLVEVIGVPERWLPPSAGSEGASGNESRR